MKKLFITILIGIGMTINSSAPGRVVKGPRLGFVFITPSPTSGLINGYLDFGDLGDDLPEDYDSEIKEPFLHYMDASNGCFRFRRWW